MNTIINPCILPQDGPERDYLHELNLYPGEVPEGGRPNYDYKTLFFDVWITHDGSGLRAIGPLFLNLERHVLPLRIYLDGEEIEFGIQRLKETPLVLLSAKVAQRRGEPYRITLDFAGNFIYRFELSPTDVFPRRSMVLTAIQKNNKSTWIKDWMGHYAQLGFKDVAIYDNNSERQDELHALETEHAKIISWPFPYGPLKAGRNKYTQVGALNHLFLRFAPDNTVASFDVDELLMISEKNLQRAKRRTVAYFPGYWIPALGIKEGEDYSFDRFDQRNKTFQDGAFKYIYNSRRVQAVDTHSVVPSGPYTNNRLMLVLRRRLRAFLTYRCPLGVFYHYKAISTNWKKLNYDRFGPRDTAECVPAEFGVQK